MLRVDPRIDTTLARSYADDRPHPEISLQPVFAFLRRARLPVALCVTAALVLGAVYFSLAAPSFTAQAELTLDARRQQTVPGGQRPEQGFVDNTYVQTQVELFKSERVLSSVIASENLLSETNFFPRGDRLPSLRMLKSLIGGDEDEPDDYGRLRAMIQQLKADLQVERAGLTSVIEIRYRSHDPQMAARLANAVARAYIDDQIKARHEVVRRNGEWLQDRIGELREQSAKAARDVQEFKTSNNIVETPRGRLNEQQLGELTSQLVTAQILTAETGARLARVDEMLRVDPSEVSIGDALRSEVITRLRTQFLDASQRVSEISARFSPSHPMAVEARNQMSELRRTIGEEIRRIAESMRSDHEIALTRQKAIEASFAASLKSAAVANDALLKLRELESTAQSFRTIYDAFLRSYTESIQTESYAATDARVVTEASAPLARSHPKRRNVLAISAVLGLLLGLGLTFARDSMRGALFSRGDVERHLGTGLLGAVPKVSMGRRVDPLRYAEQHPSSPFAESLRRAGLGIQATRARKGTRIVGIASALRAEGRTTLAANLAYLMAAGGAKVLLVDADLRSRALTRLLGRAVAPGIVELVASKHGDLADSYIGRLGNFDFLPAGMVPPLATTSDILASSILDAFFEKLQVEYDLVIVDMPPVLATVDARVAVRLIDCSVVVVEWGRTHRSAVNAALDAIAPECAIVGCVLNKTNPKLIRQVEGLIGIKVDPATRG